MLAILDTTVDSSLRGELVRVEVDVAPGLPSCQSFHTQPNAKSRGGSRLAIL